METMTLSRMQRLWGRLIWILFQCKVEELRIVLEERRGRFSFKFTIKYCNRKNTATYTLSMGRWLYRIHEANKLRCRICLHTNFRRRDHIGSLLIFKLGSGTPLQIVLEHSLYKGTEQKARIRVYGRGISLKQRDQFVYLILISFDVLFRWEFEHQFEDIRTNVTYLCLNVAFIGYTPCILPSWAFASENHNKIVKGRWKCATTRTELDIENERFPVSITSAYVQSAPRVYLGFGIRGFSRFIHSNAPS